VRRSGRRMNRKGRDRGGEMRLMERTRKLQNAKFLHSVIQLKINVMEIDADKPYKYCLKFL